MREDSHPCRVSPRNGGSPRYRDRIQQAPQGSKSWIRQPLQELRVGHPAKTIAVSRANVCYFRLLLSLTRRSPNVFGQSTSFPASSFYRRGSLFHQPRLWPVPLRPDSAFESQRSCENLRRYATHCRPCRSESLWFVSRASRPRHLRRRLRSRVEAVGFEWVPQGRDRRECGNSEFPSSAIRAAILFPDTTGSTAWAPRRTVRAYSTRRGTRSTPTSSAPTSSWRGARRWGPSR